MPILTLEPTSTTLGVARRRNELSLVFARYGRQRRCMLRSVSLGARTDSREAVCRVDDRATLLRSRSSVSFVVNRCRFCVSLGKQWLMRLSLRRETRDAAVLISTVGAHSSNAMTATPDHERTRSRSRDSDPFTFLRIYLVPGRPLQVLSIQAIAFDIPMHRTKRSSHLGSVLLSRDSFWNAWWVSRWSYMYVSTDGIPYILGTVSPVSDNVRLIHRVVQTVVTCWSYTGYSCTVVDYRRSRGNECAEETLHRWLKGANREACRKYLSVIFKFVNRPCNDRLCVRDSTNRAPKDKSHRRR